MRSNAKVFIKNYRRKLTKNLIKLNILNYSLTSIEPLERLKVFLFYNFKIILIIFIYKLEALSIYKKNGESPANANNKKVI